MKMMRSAAPVFVWLYLVFATVVEVVFFYGLSGTYPALGMLAILAFAISQALAIAAYYMHLRHEVRALSLFVAFAVFLVAVLLAALVQSFAH